MLAQTNWLPDSSSSAAVALGLARRISRAIRAVTGLTRPSSHGSIDAAISSLEKDVHGVPSLLHPELFRWYFELVRRTQRARSEPEELAEHIAALETTIKAVRASLDRAASALQTGGTFVDFAPVDDTLSQVVHGAERYAIPPYGETLELVPPDDDLTQRCAQALDLIRRFWPDAYDELARFVRQIAFFRGVTVIGFTDFRYHGAVFLNVAKIRGADSAVAVAEELTHEAAHNRLNAELALSPMFTNDPSETYTSPLRRDPRPMFGLFHQMFVLARLTRMYQLFEAGLGQRFPERVETFDGLTKAFQVVDAHARLTPNGQMLVESIRSDLYGLEPRREGERLDA